MNKVGEPIFVIQEHNAKHAGLHHDFRLEENGVLRSWVIRNCTPAKPGIRRLAIQVDNHPMEYATFEGELGPMPGEGKVTLYDQGPYKRLEDKSWSLLVELHGEVISGQYYLRHWKDNKWLIWKRGG